MSMKNNKVSFDFDSTLSRTDVQDYARSLVSRGFEVWICTSRYQNCKDYLWRKFEGEECNKDLRKVASDLGIPEEKIIFTNMQDKWYKMQELGFEPLFHLDDDFIELNGINRNSKTIKAISCVGGGWKKKLEKIVGGLN